MPILCLSIPIPQRRRSSSRAQTDRQRQTGRGHNTHRVRQQYSSAMDPPVTPKPGTKLRRDTGTIQVEVAVENVEEQPVHVPMVGGPVSHLQTAFVTAKSIVAGTF